jgi:hypothetical protein
MGQNARRAASWPPSRTAPGDLDLLPILGAAVSGLKLYQLLF